MKNINSRLAALTVLSHRVTVYVPATMGVAAAADNSRQVAETATVLSQLFGGATSSKAVGYWVSEEAGLVSENTTIVFAFASDEALSAGIDAVVDHCEKLKADMMQEAVALEIDGSMYFV